MNEADKLLASYPAEVQTLAKKTRELILEILLDAEECVDHKARVIGYGYGPGYKGIICTMILSKSGVKLGLAHGAALADPEKLLAGSGKVHRHAVLKDPSDLKKRGLKPLLRAAFAAWRERTTERSAGRSAGAAPVRRSRSD